MPTPDEMQVTGSMLEMFLNYCPETGVFTWTRTRGPQAIAGQEAGTLNDEGYVVITLNGIRLRAHRIAWAWMTGRWPDDDIDHEHGERANNRFTELREATRSQNLFNAGLRSSNKTGHKGVHFCRRRQKYVAQIRVNKKAVFLGRFDILNDAVAARAVAEKEHYGEFAGPSSRACFSREVNGQQV